MKLMQRYHRYPVIFIAFLVVISFSSSPIAVGQDINPVGPASISQSLIDKANQRGMIRVIARLNADYTPEGRMRNSQKISTQRARVAEKRKSLRRKLYDRGARIRREFKHIPHVAAEVDALTLEQMRFMPEVLEVVEDIPLPPLLNSSNPVIGSSTAWDAGFSGEGQTVAIIDTGVDKNHSWFTTGGNKVVSEACYSSNTSDSDSACPNGNETQTGNGSGVHCDGGGLGLSGSCSHGTHVAGIAAGNPGSGSRFGVARDADIIAIQVFSYFPNYCTNGAHCLLAWNSDMAAGLERVYDLRNSFDIASANMSIGGGQFFSTCDGSVSSALVDAIDNLRAAGIATAIAAGNDGFKTSIGSPACVTSAISVGATEDDDDVASFSNNANFVSLLAPGVSIVSSTPGNALSNYNGTSMAAPHVAGAWAVLKERNPDLSVSEALNALRTTGTLVTDQRSGGSATIPRINLGRAFNIIFADDFETDKGWGSDPFNPDSATTGNWERGNPEGTTIQLDTTVSDDNNLVTGRLSGSSAGSHDIDNGRTTFRSPDIHLAGNLSNIDLSFYYYFSHLDNSTSDDYFRASIVGNISGTSILFEDTGTNSQVNPNWSQQTISLDSFIGETINVIFEAADESGGSVVEAAVDDVLIVADLGSAVNTAPNVNAGSNDTITLPASANLDGTVTDDGLPLSPGSVTTTWSKFSGPGTVTFGNSSDIDTSASFSTNGVYVLQLSATDGELNNTSNVTITVNAAPPTTGLVMEVGEVTGVSSNWQTVNLSNSYSSMVVVATVEYPSLTSLPAVTRVRNAVGNSFDLRIQNPSETGLSGYSVHYFVVEEGLYNQASHGIDMEAVKVISSNTAENNNWGNLEARAYQGSYTNPVVTGQVMTYADTQWSSFWASTSSTRKDPPNSSFAAGKHVGEDPSNSRLNETIGYVVIESGSYTASGIDIYAVVSADNIRGIDDSATGYSIPISGLSNPNHAILSSAGIDGVDGSWPVLLGLDPVSSIQVNTVVDEDQTKNPERAHTTTQVALIAFEAITGNTAPNVNAGSNDTITLPASANLDGTVTDDGLPLSPGSVTTTWSKFSGPGTVTFGNSSDIDTSASFSTNGVYVLQLSATDGELNNTSNVTITVNAIPSSNTAPNVNAGSNDTITLPASANLDGTVTDDGLPLSPGSVTTTWSKFSGPGTVTFGNSSDIDTSASFSTNGVYVLQLSATDGELNNTSNVTITVNAAPPTTGLVMEVGEVTGVSSNWQTVNLSNSYSSMVVVATVEYPSLTSLPAVTRVRNAVGNSFDLRIQNPSETGLSGYSVHYFVVEEGLYNQASHGIDMEAVKVISSNTAENNNWGNLEARAYQGSYTNPVVTGQVMTYADTQWSSFWASTSSTRKDPPNSSFAAGKHVGEDPSNSRLNETIGYVVIESGSYTASGIDIYAVVSADNIRGIDDSATGYSIPISGLSNPNHAILSSAGIDGVDGSWPVLLGLDPVSSIQVNTVVDEDQTKNPERAHTTTQVALIAFEQ